MPNPLGRTVPQRSVTVAAIVLFAASLALVATGVRMVAAPSQVLAASSTKAAACAVNVRAKASTSSKVRISIKKGTQVTVVKTVKGGKYATRCAGERETGKKWLKISAVNGKSAKSRWGVKYVYAAKELFKAVPPAPFVRAADCNAKLRTDPSTKHAARTTIPVGTRVTVVDTVKGASWDTSCGGRAVSGSSWYKISRLGSNTVKALYGVSYLYSAKGLFSAITSTTPEPPANPPPPTSGTTEGIDISHWQGVIDWPTVRAAGKHFAIMKASESTDFVDDTYETNRAQAKAAGLLVGAYHFARPSKAAGIADAPTAVKTDAAAEADHFLATAGIRSGELLPVLDLERDGGLSKARLQDWVRAYLGRIYERTGVRGVIYMSPAFWVKYAGDTTWFADNGYRVLWIAHWTSASAPTLPADDWGGNGWTFWQYTSSGTVPGISGRVDLDRFNGTDFSRVLIP